MSGINGNRPRVSVIMPFLNAEPFIAEAIDSVLAQTYAAWELLLIDDGATDGSTEIARRYAELHPDRIRYLAHPGRENRGASAARNLGLAHARGDYIALLDADDVYLHRKLEEQVPLLDEMPEAGIVCNSTLIWYGWTGKAADARRDYVLPVGVPPDTLLPPSALLAQLLHGRAHAPCTCSVLMRRRIVEEVGGFEEEFRKVFTDQVFFAKLFLATPIFVAGSCWDKYRQHAHSACAVTDRTGEALAAEVAYLQWLGKYLSEHGWEGSEVWQALHSYVWWRHRHPALFRLRNGGRRIIRVLSRVAQPLAQRLTSPGTGGKPSGRGKTGAQVNGSRR